MKYRNYIELLEDDKCYCPAQVVDNGLDKIYPDITDAERALERRRVRISLGRAVKRKNFPKDGDGVVRLLGHLYTAYSGRRWKEAAGLACNLDFEI